MLGKSSLRKVSVQCCFTLSKRSFVGFRNFHVLFNLKFSIFHRSKIVHMSSFNGVDWDWIIY